MEHGQITFGRFLVEHRRHAGGDADLMALLRDVARAVKEIAAAVSRGSLAGHHGDAATDNSQGERQKKLDILANEIVLRSCEWNGQLAGLASEEMERPHEVPAQYPRGEFLLVFDPLDGSGNIDVNVTVGTIFSVLRRPVGVAAAQLDPFLQPGCQQICAGYALYGPTTMLVLASAWGVQGFTLDRDLGEFVLTHPDLRISDEAREFAINASNERFWELPVRRYVDECRAGKAGPRGADFNMRWVASMVADVHRILVRGGIYLYPRDTKEPRRTGRLRLLYEVAPMAFVVERAGGAASTGRERLLDVTPTSLHERIPVILGSRAEVERLVRYHREHDACADPAYRSPLFNERSLFNA